MSITDHAGSALPYDHRRHRHIEKLARRRPSAADYIIILVAVHPDIKAGGPRDIGNYADIITKGEGKLA